MNWVVGVDGCRAGWFAAFWNVSTDQFHWEVFSRLSDIPSYRLAPEVIGIDIPIGLLDAAKKGGRVCDKEARKLLGHPRASSVFSPPVRDAITHQNYETASEANRLSSEERLGISKQCFSIIPKIKEVDDFMSAERQKLIKEVHPEVCFWKMGGENATKFAKKKSSGFQERSDLLQNHGFAGFSDALDQYPRKMVARDDVLDAAAACWTAGRIKAGNAERIGAEHEFDTCGLSMEMWF